ncbi:MAG: methyltransferase domain-containing protein [Chloroflexota bacterium]
MQQYGMTFAAIYDRLWSGFAQQVAPAIRSHYEAQPISQRERSLLDLACGTGQMMQHFLAHDYRVTGIDLSAAMLAYARRNTAPHDPPLIQADAANFSLDDTFGLVVSTFDALNHLPDMDALRACFDNVRRVLASDGLFIFDLNTRAGLYANWNNVLVTDHEDVFVVSRGVYDGESDRAHTRLTGFLQREDGAYDRFAETFYNTVFAMDAVRGLLLDVGFSDAYPASFKDLNTPLDAPELQNRVFFVARRQ